MSGDNARSKPSQKASTQSKLPAANMRASQGADASRYWMHELMAAMEGGSSAAVEAVISKQEAAMAEQIKSAQGGKHSGPSRPRQQQQGTSSGARASSSFKGGSRDAGRTASISAELTKFFGLLRRFELSYDESLMVTLPKRSDVRDAFLKTLFSKVPSGKRIRIFDTHGGVGGDALAMIKILNDMGRDGKIMVSQPKGFAGEVGRPERLANNISAILEVADQSDVKVTLSVKRFQDVIASQPDSASGYTVHLLYVDVPWELPEGFVSGKQCGTAENPSDVTISLIQRMAADVFEPLEKKKASPPWYVCLKVPNPYEEYKIALHTGFMQDYKLIKAIPGLNRLQVPVYYNLLFGHCEACRQL